VTGKRGSAVVEARGGEEKDANIKLRLQNKNPNKRAELGESRGEHYERGILPKEK